MTDNEFDDIFKKRFKSHESVVPGNMWQKISSEKSRKKPVAWWFPLSVLFIAVVSYGVLTTKTNPTITVIKKPAGVEEKAARPVKAENQNKQLQGTKVKAPVLNISIRKNLLVKPAHRNNIASGKPVSAPMVNHVEDLELRDWAQDAYPPVLATTDSSQAVKIAPVPVIQEKQDESNSPTTESISAAKDKWFVEIFISPSTSVNALSAPEATYERALKKAFDTRLSFSWGSNIGYQVTKNIFLKTGIHFNQVNDIYNIPDSSAGLQNVIKNKYRFIDIPFLFTVNKTITSGFSASVTSGVIVNIASRYKGSIISPSGQTLNIKKDNIYEREAGAALFLGLSLSRQLNAKTAIFAEPYVRWQLKNITTSYQSFDHKIHIIGLSAGLRYRLFNNEVTF